MERCERIPGPLIVCMIAGVLLGAVLSRYGTRAETQGPQPPSGDFTTPATSTFRVFGVPVLQDSGPRSDAEMRFSSFRNVVSTGFEIAGMVIGLAAWAILLRRRLSSRA